MKNSHVSISNVRIYGTILRHVLIEEIAAIIPTPSSELHLLRHYTTVPSDYIDSLTGKRYEYFDTDKKQLIEKVIDEATIKAALQTKGSKFYSNLGEFSMSTPRELIAVVLTEAEKQAKSQQFQWIDCGFTISTFLNITFDQPVGTSGLVDLRKINREAFQITQESRGEGDQDKVVVNIIHGFDPEPTNKVAAQIGYYKERPVPSVMTAFPGNFAPDYPFAGQSIEEYQYNKEFWDSHAFIS